MVRLLMRIGFLCCAVHFIHGGGAQKVAEKFLPETTSQLKLMIETVQPVLHPEKQPVFVAEALRKTFVGYNQKDLQNMLDLASPQ